MAVRADGPDDLDVPDTPGDVGGALLWELDNVDGMRVRVQIDDAGDRHIELFTAGEPHHPAATLIFDPQQARQLAVALERPPLRP